jgi:hypothetical protein
VASAAENRLSCGYCADYFGNLRDSAHGVSPDKFDNAVLLKICSNDTHVLRLTDGTVWADDYRVEDWRTVC